MAAGVDHEWYLPIVAIIGMAAMVGWLTYIVWSGRIPVRGPVIERARNPSLYWFVVAFFVVAILMPFVLLAFSTLR